MASNNSSVDSQDWRAEFIEAMYSDKSVWALVLYQWVMVVIFVAGVCFNLLSCAALWQAWRARAVDYYLLNLTAVDLVAAFGILLELNGYSHSPNDFEGLWDAVCKVHYLLLFTLFNTDILTVTALAIERYVAVFHPLLLNKNPGRRMRKIICSIWLIAILESVPEMWTVCVVQTQRVSMCVYVPTSHAKVANVVLSLATFAIPLGAMCLAYARLAGAVRRAQASQAAVFNHRNNSSKINKLISDIIFFIYT
ncbi:P2Y purinoceptor 3-like [Ostrinia furnacalis]|uniref:P2Y purinoceptor 3-like n=1 Tax=Ostrinia furnacalis TaxID=93504 RepID=UPI001039A037|nr:P2Y purinoceptor 3-like [Ostrinia furnacalis]